MAAARPDARRWAPLVCLRASCSCKTTREQKRRLRRRRRRCSATQTSARLANRRATDDGGRRRRRQRLSLRHYKHTSGCSTSGRRKDATCSLCLLGQAPLICCNTYRRCSQTATGSAALMAGRADRRDFVNGRARIRIRAHTTTATMMMMIAIIVDWPTTPAQPHDFPCAAATHSQSTGR